MNKWSSVSCAQCPTPPPSFGVRLPTVCNSAINAYVQAGTPSALSLSLSGTMTLNPALQSWSSRRRTHLKRWRPSCGCWKSTTSASRRWATLVPAAPGRPVLAVRRQPHCHWLHCFSAGMCCVCEQSLHSMQFVHDGSSHLAFVAAPSPTDTLHQSCLLVVVQRPAQCVCPAFAAAAAADDPVAVGLTATTILLLVVPFTACTAAGLRSGARPA